MVLAEKVIKSEILFGVKKCCCGMSEAERYTFRE